MTETFIYQFGIPNIIREIEHWSDIMQGTMIRERYLSELPEGKGCVIDHIDAGRGLARRLAELGFIKGAKLFINRVAGGAMIVCVDHQRYALSKGIGKKIAIRNF